MSFNSLNINSKLTHDSQYATPKNNLALQTTLEQNNLVENKTQQPNKEKVDELE